MSVLSHLLPAPLLASAVLATCLSACSVEPPDAALEDEENSTDAVVASTFIRSDQLSFGRAPSNTSDRSKDIDPDFKDPAAGAAKVIAWLDDHPGFDKPLYLGCIHAWIYDTDATYRANVHTLVSKIRAKTDNKLLLYFEEQNASHTPHPVSASHAKTLRTLAGSATLLLATYLDGQDTHSDEIDIVMRWRKHYHDELGLPMSSLMIDIDLSQTPESFYYGSRGDLTEFNRVIGWALKSAYAHGFAGMHTYGNVGGNYGTKRAADSTYAALDKAWSDLAAAHPKQKFTGL
jgi:hypothetical protein